jgi:hypothetical protein
LDFWMGDARGKWEGDTLVVDTVSLSDKTCPAADTKSGR